MGNFPDNADYGKWSDFFMEGLNEGETANEPISQMLG